MLSRIFGIVMLLVVIACPGQHERTNIASLVTTVDPGIVELRLARFGKAADCPQCVLIEIAESQERAAYFVPAEPDCSLTRKGVYRLGADRAENRLIVALNDTGMNQIRSCRALVSESDLVGSFLLAHKAHIVGWAHLYFEPDKTLPLELGDAFESVASDMNPETSAKSLADRLQRLLGALLSPRKGPAA
jgi:hypothetical protein